MQEIKPPSPRNSQIPCGGTGLALCLIRVVNPMVIAIFWCVSQFPVLATDTGEKKDTGDKKENEARAAVERIGGRVRNNPDGSVESVSLLEKIFARAGRLSDEDLLGIDFGAFAKIKAVEIVGREITDSSLFQLAKVRQLDSLQLRFGKFTDKGVEAVLKKQNALRSLELANVPITDALLPAIAKLEELYWLEIRKAAITDKGIKELAKQKKLLMLTLRETEITDAAIAEIPAFEYLLSLDVRGTKVTDAGILQLAGMKNLRSLNVSDTKVTDDGKQKLLALMPALKIE